jgi:predicted small secreted protein
MKKILLAAMLAIYACAVGTGCKHTAHGAGEDIEKVGEKIQEKTR